ncbi:MAG: FHA domain-containing protein [Planctomycetota bacterium]|nr:FHA domain-containing protein [Planctomycetota bacterium]
MSLSAFVLIESTHTTGIERFWVAGGEFRLGDGAKAPCDLNNDTDGGWIEMRSLPGGPVQVTASQGFFLDGSPVVRGQSLLPGQTLLCANAMVKLVAVSASLPATEKAHTSPALVTSALEEKEKTEQDSEHAQEAEEPLNAIQSENKSKDVADSHEPRQVDISNLPLLPQDDRPVPRSEQKQEPASEPPVNPDGTQKAEAVEPSKYFFAIFESGSFRRVEVEKDVTVLGTDSVCDVQLSGERVDARHLEVRRTEEGFKVRVLDGAGTAPLSRASSFARAR